MKTKSVQHSSLPDTLWVLILTSLFCLPAFASAQTNNTRQEITVTDTKPFADPSQVGQAISAPANELACANEDLGYDEFNGKTNKIARVYRVDPLAVGVIYESGNAGRLIPRDGLPSQLALKYPYDPAKAEAFRQRQADLAVQQAAQASAATKVWFYQREAAILAELESLRRGDVEKQREKSSLHGLPAGNGRKVRLANLNNEQQQIRERILNLERQLEKVRAQRDSVR